MPSTSESAVRRRAKARGLKLQKSRSRINNHASYGTFALSNASTNKLVLGGHHGGYGASLEQCARYIDRQPIQD
jgi:hypothetical protein